MIDLNRLQAHIAFEQAGVAVNAYRAVVDLCEKKVAEGGWQAIGGEVMLRDLRDLLSVCEADFEAAAKAMEAFK